jgi:hypothetical protein
VVVVVVEVGLVMLAELGQVLVVSVSLLTTFVWRSGVRFSG